MFDRLIRATRPLRYRYDALRYSALRHKRDLAELKGVHTGEPMLIVGNGPSLNSTPLDLFVGVPAIGMNKIDMIFSRTEWRPELIVCVNSMVALQHRQQFRQSEIPVYLAFKSRRFVGSRSRRVSYFNLDIEPTFSNDLPRRVGLSATVTYVALQFAYYMGANPVILLGVDHRFDQVAQVPTYERREGADSNHFDPNYFAPGALWGLPDLVASEASYRAAREAFAADGRRVLDATVNGALEVFEKISVDEALRLTRRISAD